MEGSSAYGDIIILNDNQGNAYDKRMIHQSFAFQLEIELGHCDSEGLEEVQGVTELESECVLVDLAENDEVRGCGLIVFVVAVVH